MSTSDEQRRSAYAAMTDAQLTKELLSQRKWNQTMEALTLAHGGDVNCPNRQEDRHCLELMQAEMRKRTKHS